MQPVAYFALAFGVLISFLMISRALKKRRNDPPGVFDGPRLETRAREDIEQLMVQMQEVAREQIAKADLKIRMLNQLIVEADQKKKELEAVLGTAPEAPVKPPPPKPGNPLHEKVWALQDRGLASDAIGRETGLELGEVEMILGLRKLQRS